MPETLVTVARYIDVTEAHIAAGLLESEGIPVHAIDVNHVSANPLLAIGLGGVRLQVPASFERAARDVLANRQSLEEGSEDDRSTDESTETEASQRDLGKKLRTLRVFGIVLLLIIAFALVVSTLGALDQIS